MKATQQAMWVFKPKFSSLTFFSLFHIRQEMPGKEKNVGKYSDKVKSEMLFSFLIPNDTESVEIFEDGGKIVPFFLLLYLAFDALWCLTTV